jgi:TetR/AcrR family transcriptional repressor of nem operon
MGRTPSYDRDVVLDVCAELFRTTGYEGTSLDDIVRATGLHRGSIYSAFGSKRGLLLAVLLRQVAIAAGTEKTLDLLLVALLELAPRDPEIRAVCGAALDSDESGPAASATLLGSRLLSRAGLTAQLSATDPTTSEDA